MHTVCIAQVQSKDSLLAAAVKFAEDQYFSALGPQVRIYNGRVYVPARYRAVGHPFFVSTDPAPATIKFQDIVYTGIPALYDVYNEQLIIDNANAAASQIILPLHLVKHFTLNGHFFVYKKPGTAPGLIPAEGFFELLYTDQQLEVLSRRKKVRKDQIEGRQKLIKYLTDDSFFILKDGVYHPVKSKSSVLNVFKEHKPALRTFLRKSSIGPFAQNRELAIVALAQQYSILTSQP